MTLKELRIKHGYTSQIQFAKKIGAKNKAVSMWENNNSKPRIFHICKIASVLGVTTDEVLSCFVEAKE